MTAIMGMPMHFSAKNAGGGSGGKKAAAKSAGTGTGTATEEKTGTDTKTKVKVEVHTGLAKIMKQHDAATEQAATFLVEMCELIERDHISNPVLIKTIMETRGVVESSAKSQASRMRALLKDKDSFDALKRGEATVRAAVKGAQARRPATPANNQKKLDKAINELCTTGKAMGQDKKTLLTTVEAALDKAGIK